MVRSAVVVLETANEYVLQRRPNLPGKLAYPGRLQFLGGHANEGEALHDAGVRELCDEETDLDRNTTRLDPLWEGEYPGEDRDGKPITRHVGLFRAIISRVPRLREQGELVTIPKTLPAVEAVKDQLTPFAYQVLGQLAAGEQVWL